MAFEQSSGDENEGFGGEEPAAFDRSVFGRIAAIFPPARLQMHLASFDQQLATAFAEDRDAQQLQDASHKLITQAGMLGFLKLSELCREVEEAVETGAPIATPLENAREGAEEARIRIAELQAEIGGAAA
jgi:HPt (histidine-containing phosphotransfer) domain-containing protein